MVAKSKAGAAKVEHVSRAAYKKTSIGNSSIIQLVFQGLQMLRRSRGR